MLSSLESLEELDVFGFLFDLGTSDVELLLLIGVKTLVFAYLKSASAASIKSHSEYDPNSRDLILSKYLQNDTQSYLNRYLLLLLLVL